MATAPSSSIIKLSNGPNRLCFSPFNVKDKYCALERNYATVTVRTNPEDYLVGKCELDQLLSHIGAEMATCCSGDLRARHIEAIYWLNSFASGSQDPVGNSAICYHRYNLIWKRALVCVISEAIEVNNKKYTSTGSSPVPYSHIFCSFPELRDIMPISNKRLSASRKLAATNKHTAPATARTERTTRSNKQLSTSQIVPPTCDLEDEPS